MPDKQVYEWTFDIPVPREHLWDFVSDTERINRLAGLFAVEYTYESGPNGGSIIHGKASSLGVHFSWIERPCEWEEPVYFKFTREYDRGPFRELISTCRLSDTETPGTTKLVHRIEIIPRSALWAKISKFVVGVETKKGFTRAYKAAPEWYRNNRQLPVFGSEVPKVSARSRQLIETKLLPLADSLQMPEIGRHLADYLLSQPESTTAELHPYQLADEWSVNRKRTLELMLHATRKGLMDMSWSLLCPSCRRSKLSIPSLSELTETGHCESCNLNFGVEFDRCVEVTFSPMPMGLGNQRKEYCHSGPMNTPHRLASCTIPAGDIVEFEIHTNPGTHNFLSPQTKGGVLCDFVDDDSLPCEADIEITTEAVTGVPPRLRSGNVTVRVKNTTAHEVVCMVESAAWADTAATAAEVTTLGIFRELFSSEVLAPGSQFSIRNLTFLFSDLVGSTSMYDRIGDAKAYSLVRDHFELLKDIYSSQNGTLVKTIGDSVMAVFREPEAALAAAIQMQQKIPSVKEKQTGEELRLRIGLHSGACIAVEANGKLDYFGTTVNTASRVEHAAKTSELVITKAVLDSPGVRHWIERNQPDMEQESLQLKGLQDSAEIYRIHIDLEKDYQFDGTE